MRDLARLGDTVQPTAREPPTQSIQSDQERAGVPTGRDVDPPACERPARSQPLVQRGNRRGLGVEALEELHHPAIDVVTNTSGLVQ